MSEAFDILSYLRGKTRVSVPQMQIDLRCSYIAARKYITDACCDGWIAPEPEGVCYLVYRDRFDFRKMTREEMRETVELMCDEHTRLILALRGKGFVSERELKAMLEDAFEIREFIALLIERNLAVRLDGGYRLLIDKETAEKLCDMFHRHSSAAEMRRRAIRREATLGHLRHLVVTDEDNNGDNSDDDDDDDD